MQNDTSVHVLLHDNIISKIANTQCQKCNENTVSRVANYLNIIMFLLCHVHSNVTVVWDELDTG